MSPTGWQPRRRTAPVKEYGRLLDAPEELKSIHVYAAAVALRKEAIPFDRTMEELKRARA